MLHALNVRQLDIDPVRGTVILAIDGLHRGERVSIRLDFPMAHMVERSEEASRAEAMLHAQQILRCAAVTSLPIAQVAQKVAHAA